MRKERRKIFAWARERETLGEKLAESETGVCVCPAKLSGREKLAWAAPVKLTVPEDSSAVMTIGICLPQGPPLCHRTHTYTRNPHKTDHRFLGISLIFWGHTHTHASIY